MESGNEMQNSEIIIQSEPAHTPLEFFFNGRHGPRPTPPPIDYEPIKKDMANIDSLSIDELDKLYNKYIDLHNEYIRCSHPSIDLDLGVYGIQKTSPYKEIYRIFMNKIENYYPEYKEPIILKETEETNGYRLYDCENNIFNVCDFLYLKKIYENNKPMSWEVFQSKYEVDACSDWAKMDDNGECFAGFWQSEDPEIKSNAYQLSYDSNCKKLYELPFGPEIKLWSIRFGCPRRQESVRWSNFWCEWIKRKILQTDNHIKQVDKKLQTEKFKDILKNIAMEPSRILSWYLDIDEKKSISSRFNTEHYNRPLIDIIRELDITRELD
jgi:hypothetical protein